MFIEEAIEVKITIFTKTGIQAEYNYIIWNNVRPQRTFKLRYCVILWGLRCGDPKLNGDNEMFRPLFNNKKQVDMMS